MAHLWVKNDAGRWAVLPLEGDAFVLSTNPPSPLSEISCAREALSRVVLLCRKRAEELTWILVSGQKSEARINGSRLTLGVQTITDRDEIRVEGIGTFYFSTESLAKIEPFPGSAESLYCPRCKQAVLSGNAAVKCPQCRTWYHQEDDLPCWSYAETCSLCPQVTDFNAGFRWTPEEL